MSNEHNLRPVRTKEEARERGRNGGKKSGEARRRKANFRKTLNMLLTAEIDSAEWKPMQPSEGHLSDLFAEDKEREEEDAEAEEKTGEV